MKGITHPHYHAYVLRLWRDGEGAPWRANLEDTESGQSKSFAEIHMLTAFLEHLTGEARLEGPPTTRPAGRRQGGG